MFQKWYFANYLENDKINKLHNIAQNSQNKITIDLLHQKIITHEQEFEFNIDQYRKKCLMEGLDDIALTLLKSEKISQFESRNKKITSWLY